MPTPYSDVIVPTPFPAAVPLGTSRSHHRVVVSGAIEGQQWINILWFVLDFPDPPNALPSQKNAAIALYVENTIIPRMTPITCPSVEYTLIQCAQWDSGTSDPDLGPPAFRPLLANGTRPGVAPPSFVTTPVIGIYTAHDGRSRIKKVALPPLPEADYDESFVGPGLATEFNAYMIAVFEDDALTIAGVDGRLYNAVRAWTGTVDGTFQRIYESKSIDYVYVSALAGTMRRRKWGRGA